MTYSNKNALHALSASALALACLLSPGQAAADSNPFVGEIMATGIGFCPRGWADANGQLLPVSGNDALFSLYGTTFGGDGRTTFGLPDLRGRTPMGDGTGPGLSPRRLGAKGGQEQTTLTVNQLPSHNHPVNATNSDGTFPGPGDKILAAAHDTGSGAETIYSDQAANVQMSPQMIAPTGGNQPLGTLDPTEVVRYCVALFGIYPSRN
ncbi:phage tail protein [Vannielia litorea]|uniref:phage tail protein n=1 Tax=Vannielia litorea TaxID=1217970 RepID=UPI001BD04442|nr:tail fiber protein [Vannielia litorea]MBS8225780.1 phage tail protein [Vannielia litorea]